jgi:hypothetical protein
MRAVGEEALEPRFRFGHSVGLGDAGDVKAAQLCLRVQCRLDLNWVG